MLAFGAYYTFHIVSVKSGKGTPFFVSLKIIRLQIVLGVEYGGGVGKVTGSALPASVPGRKV